MKKLLILLLIPAFFSFSMPGNKAKKTYSRTNLTMAITTENIIKTLIEKYGTEHKIIIEKGVKQAASLWTEADGDEKAFSEFCTTYYAKPGDEKKALFE